MSFTIASSISPERRAASAYSRWRASSGVSINSSTMPRMPFIGVRISCETIETNSSFSLSIARRSVTSWKVITAPTIVADSQIGVLV